MGEVASYSRFVYGSPPGYQTNRAQIQLSDSSGESLAWVRLIEVSSSQGKKFLCVVATNGFTSSVVISESSAPETRRFRLGAAPGGEPERVVVVINEESAQITNFSVCGAQLGDDTWALRHDQLQMRLSNSCHRGDVISAPPTTR